jgi:hypothetical protein
MALMDLVTKTCEQCGGPFPARREHARFCSARCRVAHNRAAPKQATTAQAGPTAILGQLDDLALYQNLPASDPDDFATRVLALRDAQATIKAATGSDWQPPSHGTPSGKFHPLTELAVSFAQRLDGYGWPANRRREEAKYLIHQAILATYEAAAGVYEWERSEALQQAAEDQARAAAEHDAGTAAVQPAKGTRDLLRQIKTLTGELLKRDPYTYAQRLRRADLAEARAETEDAFPSEAQEWLDQAVEAMDERD